MVNVNCCPTETQLMAIIVFLRLCCHRAQGKKYLSRFYNRRVQKKDWLQKEVLPINLAGFVERYKKAQM
jgi:hypothetical protein